MRSITEASPRWCSSSTFITHANIFRLRSERQNNCSMEMEVLIKGAAGCLGATFAKGKHSLPQNVTQWGSWKTRRRVVPSCEGGASVNERDQGIRNVRDPRQMPCACTQNPAHYSKCKGGRGFESWLLLWQDVLCSVIAWFVYTDCTIGLNSSLPKKPWVGTVYVWHLWIRKGNRPIFPW